jgi:cellulose synthase/poly-beta-1,6-N-acetylglucosamine synthase-like glycosyltransferase
MEARPGGVHTTDREPPVRVSVIMPVKNEASRIANALEAIARQSLPPFEILVVDGHSGDGTADIARTHGARVFYEDYRTRAGACHVGVLRARGDLVAFTDADCVPDPEWLRRLVTSLSEGVVGVGGRIVNESETFWQRSIDGALDTVIGSANSVQGRMFPAQRFVSSISGSNSLYRRSDLLAVGGFRTDLVTTEDTELNRRLLARGRLLYVPNAIVRHRHGRGLRDFARRMFEYGFGRGQSLLVGPPILMPIASAVLVALAIVQPLYALILALLYGGALVASGAVAAARKRHLGFLVGVPVAYAIEHASYVAGFWTGIVRSRLPRARRAGAAREGAR